MAKPYNFGNKPNDIECTECEWEGNQKDLTVYYHGEDYFECCPNCKTDKYLKGVE